MCVKDVDLINILITVSIFKCDIMYE